MARGPGTGRGRGIRLAHLNEARKNSLWFVPSAAVLGAILAANASLVLDYQISLDDDAGYLYTSNVEDARQVMSTIATAMLTFVGVVFSITLVALQLASTQYSPRVVRSFVRNPMTKWTLGVFLATFTFAFTTLTGFESDATNQEGTAFVPAISVFLASILVLASLFVFIAFVHAIVRSMRVSFVIARLADETRKAIHQNQRVQLATTPAPDGPPDAVVAYAGRPGVVAGIDSARLLEQAGRAGVVLRVVPPVGAYVASGDPVVEVYGRGDLVGPLVWACFDVGVERTLYQDPAYGFRQLVDIAIRALSPAVNDPTTAVQVVDRLVELLGVLAAGGVPGGTYLDDDGEVRLVVPAPGWDRYVDLAFTEIRHYGSDAPQVSRRLAAAYEHVLARVPEGLRPAVADQREMLREEVAARVGDGTRIEAALIPDPIGLG